MTYAEFVAALFWALLGFGLCMGLVLRYGEDVFRAFVGRPARSRGDRHG